MKKQLRVPTNPATLFKSIDMTTATHTPEPWTIGTNSDNTRSVYDKYSCIADCYGDDALANARLIAAAPELLEALKFALAELRNCGGHVDEFYLSMGDKAIAKAEGK